MKFNKDKIIKFDTDYENALKQDFGIIVSHLPLNQEFKDEIRCNAWQLYIYAKDRLITPDDLGRTSKQHGCLSITLIFFSMLKLKRLKINNKLLSCALIFHALGEDYRLLGLKKYSVNHFSPSNFYPFLPSNLIENLPENYKLRLGKDSYKSFDLVKCSNFLKRVLDSGLRVKLKIKHNDAPTQKQLKDYGCGGFVSFVTSNPNYTWIDIIKAAGLITKFEKKRAGYNINNYIKELKQILNSGFREELGLNSDEAPTRIELTAYGYSDFINSLVAMGKRKNFTWTDVVEKAHLKLRILNTSGITGQYQHWIVEYVFVGFTRKLNLFSFYEPRLFFDDLNRADNSIIRDRNFIRLIESKQKKINIPSHIKLVFVDYTSSSDLKTIRRKCFKVCFCKNNFLIIVIFKKNVDACYYYSKIDIPYKNNIAIVSANEFVDFMGYYGDYEKLFFNAMIIGKKAYYDKKFFCTLQVLSKKCLTRMVNIGLNLKLKLKTKYNPINGSGFIEFLKKKNLLYLLKANSKKFGLDKFIKL